jgi:gas vesicle protein
MADGYDRFENEGSGGGSFVMGLLTGTVLGAGLGMVFAPKAGSELRNQLSEQAGNLANTASEGYRKASENAGQWAQSGKAAATELADRGRDLIDKAKDAVNRGTEEAQRYVREATDPAPGPGSSGTRPRCTRARPSGETALRNTNAPARGTAFALPGKTTRGGKRALWEGATRAGFSPGKRALRRSRNQETKSTGDASADNRRCHRKLIRQSEP